MAEIKVEEISGEEFRVRVQEEGGETVHRITLDKNFADKLGLNPEEAVRRSFEFLLAREPKESIMSSFSIPTTILKFFPDFSNFLFGVLKCHSRTAGNHQQVFHLRKIGDDLLG